MRRLSWSFVKPLIIICTPLALLPLPLVIKTKEAECAYVLILMAVYWMTEVLPLSVTALLPALLFPLFGLMKSSQVASAYFKDFHLLLLGIICLATAIEKWGLHQRIALRLVTALGVNPGMLMLGFMVGCAFLSMWLSNTSTVAMVMPIVEAVIQKVLNANEEANKDHKGALSGISNPALQLEDIEAQCDQSEKMKSIEAGITETIQTAPEEPDTVKAPTPPYNGKYRTREDHMMCKGLSLSIAYASSIGGLTTLSGTSTNLIFAEYIYQYYPECTIINFGNWFVLCLPICIIMLILSWIFLHWMFLGSNFRASLCSRQKSEREKNTAKLLLDQYNSLGPICSQEIITLVIFILMAILWFTRNPGFMPGWSSLFSDQPGYATDATVALLLGFMFFIIPAHKLKVDHYEALITWKDFQACMPWEISLLVGGGFALAEGTKISGLSSWFAELLTPLGSLPPLATVTIACLIVTSITEVASNAATTTIFLPILASLAEAIGVNPLFMLVPMALCVSFSFMLPVSNPPNAIVFTYGHLTTLDMVKAGLGLNVIGILTVLLALTTWAPPLLHLDTYPDWAPVVNSTGV
ncbi:solute carrier family 13 member 1 [Pimephales promelas]|uniref:solute carrier family 13 member 1 n=1 Tax=Pimephales promelas TaxID=90988 RepID=UPI0019558F0E|nr:solute carrier family 13 member 1 [Pimephales promelas]KAG1933310.1 solute carrier family [Pimephales promelas]